MSTRRSTKRRTPSSSDESYHDDDNASDENSDNGDNGEDEVASDGDDGGQEAESLAGEMFVSWADFDEFLDAYCKRTFQVCV
ncbi:hypothetical protein PINS_up014794 [Pythium insidiosum]|nr:hypothetical protein PINS_up014794 [Pythium insidiosum]